MTIGRTGAIRSRRVRITVRNETAFAPTGQTRGPGIRKRASRRAGRSSQDADRAGAMQADRLRSTQAEIEADARYEGTAVVDHDGDGLTVAGVRHGQMRAERQRAVG